MAKEALFNILENTYYFEDIRVLDLFSGIGSISYEFASRGAVEVIAVEMNAKCTRFIQDTTDELGFKNIKIIRSNAFSFVKMSGLKYDIIFADPPYELKGLDELVENVFKNDLLNDEGVLIIEHSRQYDFSGHPQFVQLRKYGKVNFSFFEVPSEVD